MALFDDSGGIIEGAAIPRPAPPIPRRKPDRAAAEETAAPGQAQGFDFKTLAVGIALAWFLAFLLRDRS